MKAMAISLLTLLFLPLISSLEVRLDSPKEVEHSKEFKVQLLPLDGIEGIYDVKIYAEDPLSNPKTISQILNNEKWQSSYYYIKESFPTQTEYTLQINKEGTWDICLRLRKGLNSPTTPECNSIKVIGLSNSSQSQEINETSETTQEKNIEEQVEEDTPKETTLEETPQSSQSIQPNQLVLSQPINEEQEAIVLNSPYQSTSSKEPITTSQGTLRKIMIYAFVFLLLVIIILLALRNL